MHTHAASPNPHAAGKRRWPALVLVAATLIATSILPALQQNEKPIARDQASGPLVGVVGHWTDSTMGTAGIVVNGERWSGATTADVLRSAGMRLFGKADPAFISNGQADGAFPFAVHEATPGFASGTLRVQFNLLGGKSDQFAGVMFGLNARGEYYAARYNTKDGNLAIWAFGDGARRVLAKGPGEVQLPLNSWQTLEVTVKGKEVRVALSGHPTLTLTHTLDAAPEGRVGLWAKRDAITAFRDFAVRE